MAETHGDRTAISFLPNGATNDHPVNITHTELLEKSTQVANLLDDLGVGKDEVVAIVTPNLIETIYTIIGAETAGIALPIPPYVEPEKMAATLNKCKAKVLITFGFHQGFDTWRYLQHIQPELETTEHFIIINTDIQASNDLEFECHDFHTEINKQPKDHLKSNRVISPNDIATYVQTSGSTGTAKTIERTHASQVFHIWSQISTYGFTQKDSLIYAFPICDRDIPLLTHLSLAVNGGKVIIQGAKGYSDENVINHFWNIVNKYKVTTLLASPSIIQRLLNSASIENKEFESVRFLLHSGERLSQTLHDKFKEKTNINLLQVYSLTESCFLGTHHLNQNGRTDCIGIREAYTELKVVKLDTEGNQLGNCNTGDSGALFIRGPHLAKYVDDELNSQQFTDDGWFNTGDSVKQGSDGIFWYIGRTMSQIKINGSFLNPEPIENDLNVNTNIAESVVVNMPHGDFINVPVSFVTLVDEKLAEETTTSILEHFEKNYATHSEVIITNALKRTSVGKLDRVSPSSNAQKIGLQNILVEDISRLGCEITIEMSTNDSNSHHASISIKSTDKTMINQAISHTESKLELHDISYSITS